MLNRFVPLLCLLLALMVTACEKKELYGNLDQRDANEIVVQLYRSGIDAKLTQVTRQNRTTYSVQVDADDLDRARAIMNENNLPRIAHPGLADVFKDPGFIPTPQEQKARYVMALKGEIINSLEKIPDVVEADALVNIPNEEEFGSDEAPRKPTASVVLKVRPTEQAMQTLTESKVQRFVSNAVEKLDPRDVSVILTYVGEPREGIRPGQSLILSDTDVEDGATVNENSGGGEIVSVAGLNISPDSVKRLKLYLGLFLILVAALSFGLVVMVVQASRMRQAQSQIAPQLAESEDHDAPQLSSGL